MEKNVLEYLEESAGRAPDKIACEDVEKKLTYIQLMSTAKSIGTYLNKKVEPGQPVPVFMEKGCDALTAFLGIVYAGAFYTLLDSQHPINRLENIINTLEAKVIVVDEDNFEKAKELNFDGEIIIYSQMVNTIPDDEVLGSIRNQALDIDPLYAIFTSGSTGVPKGVVVGHRSVIDFINCFTEIFGIDENDVIGNQAPFDFDVSVKDIYSALKCGATLQIIPKKYFSVPKVLLDYLEERKVTTLIWAVSALCIITTLKGFNYKVPQYIKKVMFSGEVMPMKHLKVWQQTYPDAMFVNLYGPTEITCNCTYYIVDREFTDNEVLPMGKAFPNEKVFLLDEDDKLITSDMTEQLGEICVSGTALSMGYYNAFDKTNQAFVQNPINKKYIEMIYRTGDLGRYDSNGELYFASRKDFQIKHNGHRIELGEVEGYINAVNGVERACCLYEDGKIVAFYVGVPEKKEIYTTLLNDIPKFMMPNVFKKLDNMPLTKNGKIDRGALKTLL